MSNERERALEAIKAIIAEKFAPAIDFKAPYAKVMLDLTARALLASSPPPSCERMEDALHMIKQWADAYPVDVFRPISDEKLKEANEALKAIGVDMGALHAGWARHIVDGIGNIARAALDANRTEEPWQPIETAPKDGTEILTYSQKHDEWAVVWWRHGEWLSIRTEGHDGGVMRFHDLDCWMPLPTPPSRTEEKS